MIKNNNKNNNNNKTLFFQILKKSKVTDLINNLSDIYETKLENLSKYYFYSNSKGKTFISKIEISELNFNRINSIGLYFGTFHDEHRFRLSIEGSRLIKPKNNYIKISKKQLKNYLAAENLFITEIEELKESNKSSFLIVNPKFSLSIGIFCFVSQYFISVIVYKYLKYPRLFSK